MRGILVPVRTDAQEIVEYEHDDPEQVTEQERAALRAETHVEEGTAAELKSQIETVINKHELIDVASCTRGHGYKGVVTRWSAPGFRGRHTVVSGRMRVLERGIQPAFSGKCLVQVNQVSNIETMLDEAREECNRLELRRWRLKEENRLSEGTALERDGEVWSLAERTWVST